MIAPLASVLVDALNFIGRNGQIPGAPPLPTLTHLTLKTLEVAGIGIGIALAIGLPVGLWLGHLHRGSFIAINVGNVWRALPSLAVLAIGVAFLGIGLRNVELALVVLAVPPIITNAYVAVDGIEADIVDAARGMGMTEWRILLRVEVPLGTALIFAGIRTAALFVVSTTTIAALTGFSGTLGDVINNETSYHLSGVLGGAIVIAGLALAVEFALAAVQRALTPRGLKFGEDSVTAALVPVVQEAG
jgi:osmoprotectant transport system permease protein